MEVVLHLPVAPNVELVAAKAVETVGGALGMHQTGIEAASVAIVEAVPIVMQCPGLRTMHFCRSFHCSSVISPARHSVS